jgi:hypothetical protein
MQTMKVAMLATTAIVFGMAGARAAERSYDLEPFREIDVATGIHAIVTTGAGQAVSVETSHAETLDKLDIHVENGKLVARLEGSFFDFIMGGGLLGALVNGRPDITLTISAQALDEITASSGALVEADAVSGNELSVESSSGSRIEIGEVTVGEVEAEASSGSGIVLAGTCDELDAGVSSGASIDMAALECSTADVEASSGARLTVFASMAVEAYASSGASIAVHGNPQRQDIGSSSGGNVDLADR